MFRTIVIINVLLYLIKHSIESKIGILCQTEQKLSPCIPINQCKFFDDYTQRNNHQRPYPRNVLALMHKYYCGLTYGNVNTPKVCCPQSLFTKPHKPVFSHPECGVIQNGYRITGGAVTALMEFPWMALILYDTDHGTDYYCSGAIINEKHVLTSAHCVRRYVPFGVRLGEYNINTSIDCDQFLRVCAPAPHDSYIEKIIVHPKYVGNSSDDNIAIIKLENPVNFNAAYIKPICLPLSDRFKSDKYINGKFGVVAGWGLTEQGYKSPVMLKTLLPIVPKEYCLSFYQIKDTHFCAGGVAGRNICEGDSGGPLQIIETINGQSKFVLYGIANFANRMCGQQSDQPTLYTKVTEYVTWILENIND